MSAFFAVTGAVIAATSCNFGTSLGSVDAGTPDAGPVLISCADASECPVDAPECSFGICKRPCASSSGCVDLATYCNLATGYCEPGCRDSAACGEGDVCSNGACIASAGCGSKCDCQPGQVCVGGACEAPPATCTSSDQCPRGSDVCEDFSCNGFTQACFDPPQPCEDEGDCAGFDECAGGCTCTNGSCVAPVGCTPETVNEDCGPSQICDAQGNCQVATCSNGGITCGVGQTCAADGRCVTPGTGDACTGDAQCPSTQYCNFVAGQGGQCADGCRDNASCQPNQQCNGTHQCVNAGGGLGGQGAPCTDDSACQNGLVCDVNGTCEESCANYQRTDCAGQPGCCELTGKPCCNFYYLCTDGILGSGNCLQVD